MTIHRLWLLSNTTGATSEAGVAFPSAAPELTLVFVGFVFSLIFSVVLFVLCLSFISFCWPWSCLSSDICLPLWYLWIPFSHVQLYSAVAWRPFILVRYTSNNLPRANLRTKPKFVQWGRCGHYLCWLVGLQDIILRWDYQRTSLMKFGSICLSDLDEKIL